MQIDTTPSDLRHGRIRFTRSELARAHYTDRGAYDRGRDAEFDALREMGARDPSLGRMYEGHFNGALLVALYGNAEQRARVSADCAGGELFGVWNTQDADGVHIDRVGERYVLRGAKTWASGADSVTRALITATTSEGAIQMCLIPMDRVRVAIDPAAWRPLGMRESNSFRVAFDDVELEARDLIGEPADYERSPWFLAGSIRFAAVHCGIVERIVDETIDYVTARKRDGDPLVRARVADMELARRASIAWLATAARLWSAYDAAPTPEATRAVIEIGDLARTAIERAALETLECAIRTVGAHGMVEPLPFAALFRDLHMYLRQPSPDNALLRIADAAIARRAPAE